MSVKSILNLAASYIQQGYTTEVCARDKDGEACDPCGSEAVSWCTYGALYRARTEFGFLHDDLAAAQVAIQKHTNTYISSWSDSAGQQVVVDTLIKLAETA